MGPFRRRLTAATGMAALPAAAFAEVCDKVRPDWEAGAGPQGWLAETVYILASPPSLVLVLLLALALWLPRLWIALPVALLTLAFAALLAISRQTDMAELAIAEGCIATAAPAIVTLTVGALVGLARALARRRR